MRRITRRFPDYGWAWPAGAHDQLLQSVLVADEPDALRRARTWLDTTNIDDAPFRDHRLLATVAHRFGRSIADHPTYPRLIGLQRNFWAQAQFARREAEPALARLVALQIPFILLKAASRTALDPSAEKSRVARDIDLLVRPEDMVRAFDALTGMGWQPSSGASAQFQRTQLPATRALNLFAGRFGDIDLHQYAYPAGGDDETDLWRHAVPARFGNVPALVPGPEDRAALAIAHGVLDAHAHSDWLVDCAIALGEPGFDWDRFNAIIADRDLSIGAAVTLSYIAESGGIAVPSAVIEKAVADADRQAGRWGALLQAKPRTDIGPTLNALRWVAKERRKRGARQSRPVAPSSPVIRGHKQGDGVAEATPTPFAPTHRLELPASVFGGTPTRLAVVVRVALPPYARRIELEINGPASHVARLRYRKHGKSAGTELLRFEGAVTLSRDEGPLTVESRPVRQVRDSEPPDVVARFGAVPFQIVSVTATPAG